MHPTVAVGASADASIHGAPLHAVLCRALGRSMKVRKPEPLSLGRRASIRYLLDMCFSIRSFSVVTQMATVAHVISLRKLDSRHPVSISAPGTFASPHQIRSIGFITRDMIFPFVAFNRRKWTRIMSNLRVWRRVSIHSD